RHVLSEPPKGQTFREKASFAGLEQASYALQALARRGHFSDAQTEIAVDQHHVPAGHDLVSDNQVHGIGDVAIQFDDISGTEVENLAQWHLAAPEAQRSLEFHIEQQLD